MKHVITIGRLFYGISVIVLGLQQIFMKDFRQEILSPFPEWPHKYFAFSLFAGIGLVLSGAVITDLIRVKSIDPRKFCLYLGFILIVFIFVSHLPYVLVFSPYTVWRLDVWFGVGQALALSGGAFVMAGTFPKFEKESNSFESFLETIIPAGRIFFSALIIMFGFSHFVFTDFVSKMVPEWLGMRIFWTYFVGGALIASGVAIILKIWIKPVAILLAIMLFLFLTLFHIPLAILKPFESNWGEIVRCFVALLYCGIALVIADRKS